MKGWCTVEMAIASSLCIGATVCSVGCGGSGQSSNFPDFAYYLGPSGATAAVNMNPVPPTSSPPTQSPTSTPIVTVYHVSQFESAADYWFAGNNNWTPTTQVVYGVVSGVDLSSVRVAVFAETDQFYIQPMVSCFPDINPDGTWECLSAPGDIYVLLVSKAYAVSAIYSILPVVDGTNILAAGYGPHSDLPITPGYSPEGKSLGSVYTTDISGLSSSKVTLSPKLAKSPFPTPGSVSAR